MFTRTRRMTAVAALAVPLALAGCGEDDPAAEEIVSGGTEEVEQFDQSEGTETGDENAGEEASEEGNEEPATAPQSGAED